MSMLRKLSILGVLASISALSFNVSPASAHNTFSESSPSEGQQLTTAPTEWSIVFEKPVPLNSASGAVINAMEREQLSLCRDMALPKMSSFLIYQQDFPEKFQLDGDSLA